MAEQQSAGAMPMFFDETGNVSSGGLETRMPQNVTIVGTPTDTQARSRRYTFVQGDEIFHYEHLGGDYARAARRRRVIARLARSAHQHQRWQADRMLTPI